MRTGDANGQDSRAAWEPAPNLTIARDELCVVILRGQVYAIGGLGNGHTVALKSVERLSHGANRWEAAPSLANHVYAFAAVAVDDNLIFAMGGSGLNDDLYNTTWVFNGSTDSWGRGPSLLGVRYATNKTVD